MNRAIADANVLVSFPRAVSRYSAQKPVQKPVVIIGRIPGEQALSPHTITFRRPQQQGRAPNTTSLIRTRIMSASTLKGGDVINL